MLVWVPWIRLDTEAPKKFGVVEGELGVVNTNWRPESGADSAVDSENGPPVKP